MGSSLSTERSIDQLDLSRSTNTHAPSSSVTSSDSGYHSVYPISPDKKKVHRANREAEKGAYGMKLVHHGGLGAVGEVAAETEARHKLTHHGPLVGEKLTDRPVEFHSNLDHAMSRLMKATNSRLLLYKNPLVRHPSELQL
jgi:hypothetical protein